MGRSPYRARPRRRKVGSATVYFLAGLRYGRRVQLRPTVRNKNREHSSRRRRSVLKPDFGTKRKHFIFNDEHEQLRESIRKLRHEGARARTPEEWEETTFPDWVFKRMGELGFLGLD